MATASDAAAVPVQAEGDDDDDELGSPPAQPQQPSNPFDPFSPTGRASENVQISASALRDMLQQMNAATKAASDAALAAAQAVQSSSSSRGLGAGDLSKILPRPESFNPTGKTNIVGGCLGIGCFDSMLWRWTRSTAETFQ